MFGLVIHRISGGKRRDDAVIIAGSCNSIDPHDHRDLTGLIKEYRLFHAQRIQQSVQYFLTVYTRFHPFGEPECFFKYGPDFFTQFLQIFLFTDPLLLQDLFVSNLLPVSKSYPYAA